MNDSPQHPPVFSGPAIEPPSQKRQSWGALISIVAIVLMLVIGAFYAWGKRVAEVRNYPAAAQ